MRLAQRTAIAAAMTMSAATLTAQQKAGSKPVLDIAFTYDGQRGVTTGGSGFWLQGGAADFAVTFYHGLGVVSNLSGETSSNIAGPTPLGLTMATALFGPRYTKTFPLRSHSESRVSSLRLYGEGLIGVAHCVNSIFPTPTGPQTIVNGFAAEAGGGADLALSRHVALRLVEAHWLRTQLPNGASNAENSFRAGAGIVFRITQ